MRAQVLLSFGLLLASLLAGCTGEEPAPGPDAATALDLLPREDQLGQPADWGAAIGQGPREPMGEPRLVMAFAVEATHPEGSRLVDGLYNMREHLQPDTTVGDGQAGHWLYQHRDDSTIRMQRVASADGRSDGAAWGAYWDWSYWGLASPERPLGEWNVDSDGAARIAGPSLETWGDPEWDHAYLLYVPEGHSEAHWLLAQWDHDGTDRKHAVVRATDGELVPFDSVHPDVPERGAFQGTLAPAPEPGAEHRVEPEGNRSRLVLRLTTQPPPPAGAVSMTLQAEGWETVDERGEGATQVLVLRSLGGGPVDVSLRLDGAVARYSLGWCAEGTFNDILGRSPSACDG